MLSVNLNNYLSDTLSNLTKLKTYCGQDRFATINIVCLEIILDMFNSNKLNNEGRVLK